MRVKLWYIYGYISRGVEIVRDLFLHLTPAPRHTHSVAQSARGGDAQLSCAGAPRKKKRKKKAHG